MRRRELTTFRDTLAGVNFSLILAYLLALTVSLFAAIIVVKTNGNVAAAMAFVVVIVIVFSTFYKVEWGFYIFFAMVLLFDQFLNPMPFGVPITARAGYFDNLKGNPFLPAFSAGVMNPLEVQIAMILLAWFLTISARRDRKIQGAPFWGFAVLLSVTLLASELYGLHEGGVFLTSLWELRALCYFLVLYFLVPQVIQTKKQIGVVVWIAIFMIAIKALQGDIRLIRMGLKFDGYTVLTNHEDPMFMADLFILLMGFSFFGAKEKQRKVIFWLMPVLLLGFYAGQRRAAYAGYFVALGIFVIMLSPKDKMRFFRAVLPILFVAAAYTGVFWNYHGRIAEPIQLVKSGFSKSAKGAGERFDSNLYREFERYDLAATVKAHPVIGIGFGNPFMTPVFLISLHIPFQLWIPHDQIFWLMVNMGAIGFFIFFLFFDSLVFEASRLGRVTKDPFLKAVVFMIGAMIVNQMVISYFDMQLTFYRDMVFLGTFCGLLPTIKMLNNSTRVKPAPDIFRTRKQAKESEALEA